MLMSFHNARFIRDDLPNEPVDSHEGYRGGDSHVERGSLCHRREQSDHLVRSPRHWGSPRLERPVMVSSQVATVAACVW